MNEPHPKAVDGNGNGTWTFTVNAVPSAGGSVSALLDIPIPTEAPR